MALMLDIEPPSSDDKNDDRGFKNLEHTNKLKAVGAKFLATSQKLRSSLSFYIQKTKEKFEKFKEWVSEMLSNRFLPHIAICLLSVLVAFSNLSDRAQTYALAHTVNNIDPDAELAITDSVDPYTPEIKADSKVAEKANLASLYSGGFVSNAAPTETQITARTEPLPDNSKDSVYYTVRTGDTLSTLGWKFGVKIATLAYTNDLSNNDVIKPGARLKIPVRGYEVPASLIAQKAAAKQKTVAAAATAKAAKAAIARPAGKVNNGYPFGWCTYYVATRRAVPVHWGNAGQWINSARAAGYPTGSQPAVGAIVVTRESVWGHVAYVESVNGDDITISEMNAPIWGVVTRRTISASESKIKGFIY